ncbi:YqaJ viral recombinase family protein [uncultured Lamprocystis sp.]|jgi:predicted phage-related endonuclease|uniref:YqaJ viral recombinase family protein n=1 Tax=uncultured Lamprocystis sp. TaxID=543132 RepID=UPI0025EF7C23|nr:YqaJ viral recombinase family protein [uncultured Lamprocystis sp.]
MTTMIDIAASHRERIGCSQIAPALGLSQYGTRYQLWQQYTGRAERPDISGYLRVKIGEPMEPVLMPLAAERLGRALRRDRREYLHPDLPLIGHVDYRAERLRGETVRPIVDMKTSLGFGARHRFGEDGTDEVDDGVLLQMQGYLLLTGAQIAYVVALVPGPELKIYTIQADPELHRLIETGIAEFWQCVQSDTPPDPHSEVEARQRWARHTAGKIIEADSALYDDVRELHQIKGQLKALEDAEKAIRDRLIPAIGDADAMSYDGRQILTFRANKDSPKTDWRAVATSLNAPNELIQAHTTSAPGPRVLRLTKEIPA